MAAAGAGRGVHTKRGVISSDTTTVVAPNPDSDSGVGTIYIEYFQIYVSVVGTTSTAKLQSHTNSTLIAIAPTTVLGLALDMNASNREENLFGIPVPVGEGLDIVTASGGAATFTYEITYRVA